MIKYSTNDKEINKIICETSTRTAQKVGSSFYRGTLPFQSKRHSQCWRIHQADQTQQNTFAIDKEKEITTKLNII